MTDLVKAPQISISALQEDHSDYLATWGFEASAITVPACESRKNPFAVWHGAYGERDETPVLAVEVKGFFSSPNAWPDWFYGIAIRNDVEADTDPQSALLSAALHPARTLHEAIGLLACMAPVSQSPRSPDA